MTSLSARQKECIVEISDPQNLNPPLGINWTGLDWNLGGLESPTSAKGTEKVQKGRNVNLWSIRAYVCVNSKLLTSFFKPKLSNLHASSTTFEQSNLQHSSSLNFSEMRVADLDSISNFVYAICYFHQLFVKRNVFNKNPRNWNWHFEKYGSKNELRAMVHQPHTHTHIQCGCKLVAQMYQQNGKEIKKNKKQFHSYLRNEIPFY